MSVTVERIRELVKYDPVTGEFRWHKPRPNATAGSLAGGLTPFGYIRLNIEGRPYQAHRLAWFYVTGKWPEQEVDHINGVRNDNRLVNLREATPSQNQANKAMRKDNTSGVKGVAWDKARRRWHASIYVDGKIRNLGRFSQIDDAAAAYASAATQFFGEFARPERMENV